MQVSTRHTPSFGVARLSLAGGEQVRVEAGAMMAMSAGVVLQAKAEGGVLKSLKRAALGGESFFVTTYTAPAQGGFVDVAARLPGDLVSIDVVPGRAWFVSKGGWLASAAGVTLDAKWGGFRNMFGSEGGFIVRAEGQGPLVIGCYGAMETWDLPAGQTITVDSGHMVAYEEGVTMQLRTASGGMIQSMKSGEGLVFDFTGPGRVMTQTRNPNELLGWISASLGTSGSGGGTGLGGLFGRD
jgi:uncharacterized protein (TIGR00266 family)